MMKLPQVYMTWALSNDVGARAAMRRCIKCMVLTFFAILSWLLLVLYYMHSQRKHPFLTLETNGEFSVRSQRATSMSRAMTSVRFSGSTNRGKLINNLARMMALPPRVPIREECSVPPAPQDPTCFEYGFTGSRKKKVGTVYRIIPFGFEADTLEIALREVQGLNVRVVLIESELTHRYPFWKKASQWDRIRNQSRFDKLRDMVVYRTTMNESFLRQKRFEAEGGWASERAQERYGLDDIQRVLGPGFNPEDVIVMGSPDEILTRHMMNSLSYCELSDAMMGSAIGFPHGYIEQAYRPDFRPSGFDYSFTLPTIYSVGKFPYSNIIRYFNPPNNHVYLQGGLHLTGYTLLAAAFIKDITTTDHGGKMTRIARMCANGVQHARDSIRSHYLTYNRRVTLVERLSRNEKKSYVIPWFLNCNRGRYPNWFKDVAAQSPDVRDESLYQCLCQSGCDDTPL